jgi:hypothetical protein
LTWFAILSGKVNFVTDFGSRSRESAEKSNQFPDEIRQDGPEHGEQAEDGHGAPGDLRDGQAWELTAATRLMARAEAAFHGAAIATLAGGAEVQARAEITGGGSERRREFGKFFLRFVCLAGCLVVWLVVFLAKWLVVWFVHGPRGVNVYASFRLCRHIEPSRVKLLY